jgi:hypothetical protein
MADAMSDGAYSDGAKTMTTIDGMAKWDVRGLVAVRNTFLVCEEEGDEPSPLDLRRGMSEPAKVPPTVDEGEEEEEDDDVDIVPPPTSLDRLQTMDTWENINDWQYTGAVADPEMPSRDMSSLLGPPPAPVDQGLRLESMAPQQTGGQVYFPPLPGVMPPSYAQNQPVMMMRPMQGQQMGQLPMGQPVQPMMQQPMMQQPMPMPPQQPGVPYVMPGFQPARGRDIPMSVDPYSVRSEGGQSTLGTATRPVNADMEPGEHRVDGGAAPEVVPSPPVGLEKQFSVNSPHIYRVHWTQPDKFLRSTNKSGVSPAFQIYGADWKIVLVAGAPGVNDASFKTSKGKATMKLMCQNKSPETTQLTMMFRFFAGDLPVRGPGCHDFMQSSNAQLKKGGEQPWDLMTQVKDMKVTVGVELWEVGA